GDGIVDSGETIELAVTIKNRWGKADPVTVTLAAQAAGAVGPDPFVTWDIDTVDYGAVGNFGEDDNGLIRDPEGLVTGVENPFRFTVSKDAFNNHIIPIKVSISAGNGFDAEDSNAPYGFSGSFDLIVQRGRVLPSVIEEDFIMTKDDYWIVDKPVFIPEGVTVTVTEGTQIQFLDPQTVNVGPAASIANLGSFIVEGSLDNPVELFPSSLLPEWAVSIVNSGYISLEFFKIKNPGLRGNPINSFAKSGMITQEFPDLKISEDQTRAPELFFKESSKVVYQNVGLVRKNYLWKPFDRSFDAGALYLLGKQLNCLINESRVTFGTLAHVRDCCFVRAFETYEYPAVFPSMLRSPSRENFLWENNSVLINPWYDDTRYNFRFYTGGNGFDLDISSTFWGTESRDLIGSTIYDKNDNFGLDRFIVEPIRKDAPESCWPFVVDCVLSTDLGNDVSEVGAEEVTYTVTFNRDMDTSIQPKVYFGPDDPVTDFIILGDWQDARTWVGSFEINSITGDGYQQIRIQDAVAADDAWLVTGRDIGRFRFEIVTSGTEALTLQASGGEGFVDLSWGQDDFELLAGYNLYRGDQRINRSIVPAGTTSFRDTDVEPGQNYDYYFKVVLTDMSESESSNTATGTPLDTIPAVISHSAINSAQPNLARTLAADITDNVSVVGATLFYRLAGSGAEYSSREMVNATGDRFTVTLESPLLQPPGIEYYLSATDGVSTTYSGRGETPYLIVVDDKPVVTGLTPNRGPASGGTVVQV
ncbi:hypothetical protein N9209_05785, partial [Akkermansiaceae bacterium]|nr:hypothetical protein [Akkermansiaceae bacterium]